MIPGPFVHVVGSAEAAIERRKSVAPSCSRCGSADRLRYFAYFDDVFRVTSARALCYTCDDQGLTPGSRPRSTHRASLLPLLTWALLIFLAGVAFGALLSTSSRGENSGETSEIEGSAVRAAHSRRADGPVAEEAPAPRGSSARTTSLMADDEPAASEAAPAPQPTVSTHQQSGPREDPPASVVLSVQAPPQLRAVLLAIHRAALEFSQPPGRMVGVAYCESTFDPAKVGGAGERGVWQFMPTTWFENAPRLGYGPEHITDVVASSRVAAEMWSRGLSDRWTCAR